MTLQQETLTDGEKSQIAMETRLHYWGIYGFPRVCGVHSASSKALEEMIARVIIQKIKTIEYNRKLF